MAQSRSREVGIRVLITLLVPSMVLGLASCSNGVAAPVRSSATTTSIHPHTTTTNPHVVAALTPPNEYLKLATPADQAEAAFNAALMGSSVTQLDATAGSFATALLEFANGLKTYVWPDGPEYWVQMLVDYVPAAASVLHKISVDGLGSVTSNEFATDTARVDAADQLLRQALGLPPLKPVKPSTRLPTLLV